MRNGMRQPQDMNSDWGRFWASKNTPTAAARPIATPI